MFEAGTEEERIRIMEHYKCRPEKLKRAALNEVLFRGQAGRAGAGTRCINFLDVKLSSDDKPL
jgi:hypothetical protein